MAKTKKWKRKYSDLALVVAELEVIFRDLHRKLQSLSIGLQLHEEKKQKDESLREKFIRESSEVIKEEKLKVD